MDGSESLTAEVFRRIDEAIAPEGVEITDEYRHAVIAALIAQMTGIYAGSQGLNPFEDWVPRLRDAVLGSLDAVARQHDPSVQKRPFRGDLDAVKEESDAIVPLISVLLGLDIPFGEFRRQVAINTVLRIACATYAADKGSKSIAEGQFWRQRLMKMLCETFERFTEEYHATSPN